MPIHAEEFLRNLPIDDAFAMMTAIRYNGSPPEPKKRADAYKNPPGLIRRSLCRRARHAMAQKSYLKTKIATVMPG